MSCKTWTGARSCYDLYGVLTAYGFMECRMSFGKTPNLQLRHGGFKNRKSRPYDRFLINPLGNSPIISRWGYISCRTDLMTSTLVWPLQGLWEDSLRSELYPFETTNVETVYTQSHRSPHLCWDGKSTVFSFHILGGIVNISYPNDPTSHQFRLLQSS